MTEELLAAYNAITAKTGFGLNSARDLIAAGATLPLISQLVEVDLIRVDRIWSESHITYRLLFP